MPLTRQNRNIPLQPPASVAGTRLRYRGKRRPVDPFSSRRTTTANRTRKSTAALAAFQNAARQSGLVRHAVSGPVTLTCNHVKLASSVPRKNRVYLAGRVSAT